MTGFARVRKLIPEGEIVFSLKSVNHRGLDLHFHTPPELDALENAMRGVIKAGVVRGHLQIHVSFTRAVAAGAAPLNRPLLAAWLSAFQEAAAVHGLDGKPDLNAALRIPGMLSVEGDEELSAAVEQGVLAAAQEAIESLNAFREREGAAMAEEMRQRCANIRDL